MKAQTTCPICGEIVIEDCEGCIQCGSLVHNHPHKENQPDVMDNIKWEIIDEKEGQRQTEKNHTDSMKQTISTYNEIASEYAERNLVPPSEVLEMLELFTSKLQGKKVLDVGCANGRDSKYFNERGMVVVGIDLCEPLLEIAKKECPGCMFMYMDMRQLDFPDKSFDGVWACASFLHIEKKEAQRTLREFYRVLKNNGILYISTMKGSFDGLRKNEKLKWADRHFSDYEEQELIQKAQEVGFEILVTKSVQASSGVVFMHIVFRRSESETKIEP